MNSFGQRSQYISIKFPLNKQWKSLNVLLTETIYYSWLLGMLLLIALYMLNSVPGVAAIKGTITSSAWTCIRHCCLKAIPAKLIANRHAFFQMGIIPRDTLAPLISFLQFTFQQTTALRIVFEQFQRAIFKIKPTLPLFFRQILCTWRCHYLGWSDKKCRSISWFNFHSCLPKISNFCRIMNSYFEWMKCFHTNFIIFCIDIAAL